MPEPGVRRPHGELLLDSLVANRLAARPDAPAVLTRGGRLTGLELLDRSTALAARIRATGVAAGEPVGVFVEHDLDLPVALLGALASGGCCVPIDPSLPPERIRVILDDARPRVVVTQRRLAPAVADRETVLVDAADQLVPAEDGVVADARSGRDPAFVLFTSGTTGRGKGVVHLHAGTSTRLLQVVERTPVAPDERDLLWTPLSFVAVVDELLFPLLSGIPVVVAPPRLRLDAAELDTLIASFGISMFRTTPTLLRTVLADRRFGPCPSLKRVICAGEVLPDDVRRRFFERLDAELYTAYGCTEAPGAMIARCDPATTVEKVSVGLATAGTEVEILDGDGRPAATGQIGEICLGGPGVASGYWRQPELTAGRFVTHSAPGGPPVRLFRTGDRGRRRADGAYEIVGRIDDTEVKVRGVRVDLEEVEAALAECPGVAHAVVSVDGIGIDGGRMIAHWVDAGDGPPPAPEELRARLGVSFPSAAIPSRFIRLDRLPIAPSGKVDRAALRGDLDASEPRGERDVVAPRTDLERAVAAVWREVLGVDLVGVDDPFLDLGGDSLRATLVLSRLRERYRVDLSIVRFFSEPTVAALAREIADAT